MARRAQFFAAYVRWGQIDMQTSGITGLSAAAALRALFQPQQNSGQQVPTSGQTVPSASSGAVMQGFAGPQISDGTMGGFMSLQGGNASAAAGGPASADDIASQLMSMLDANGDGSISLSEAEASGNSDAASAFAALDTNGDGKIDSSELAAAVQSAGQEMASAQGAGGVHHHHHHHHVSASDAASSIMSAVDTDSSGGLSLDEVSSALGVSNSDAQAGFSALDTNGDGQLSLGELTAAIEKYTQSRFSDYAQQAQNSTTASVTA
jgi:Ca2+-binding EF-hand superfamily protein